MSLATTPKLVALQPDARVGSLQDPASTQKSDSCWLDVCASFIVEDADRDIHSDIVLTSDTFVGTKGFEDAIDKTEYEIYLYDATGKAIGADGVAKRLLVPAMQTTVLNVSELISPRKTFWGGLKVRLRPRGREPMHASDLFSSAFVRWRSPESFDAVHANPDPLEWQQPKSFFYSMPFPPLREYEGIFGLFNPYATRSEGTIALYDNLGNSLQQIPYVLEPRSSMLVDLRKGAPVNEAVTAFRASASHHRDKGALTANDKGGTIAVTNDQGSVKNFGYLVTRREGQQRFSVEHPIHQPPYKPIRGAAPFDPDGRFRAKNILYTPLVFYRKAAGELMLDTRFHFSSGAPMEDALWLSPFITDQAGNVAWQAARDQLPSTIAATQVEHGILKLGGRQSCVFDPAELGLRKGFAGGLSLPVAPNTNHTLMKVEITVSPWNAHAFTHFRPGLQSARKYQQAKARGGLGTDYIVTNGRIERDGTKIRRDELIAILNIDDRNLIGSPTLEVFSSGGLLERIKLGNVPAFGSQYFLLSSLISGKSEFKDLSLRLIDERATLLMSVVHIDHVCHDIALDHGSDRFSTFSDYGCNTSA